MKELIVEKWRYHLTVVGAVLIILILWKIPEWQVRGYHGRLDTSAIRDLEPKDLIQLQKDLITAENNARLAIAQIIGGMVVLLGLYATFKNVRVAEEGKLTERFSKAVELLGNDKLDIRLGGIYALERISRDSQKDHWTIIEVLSAFVREQSQKRKVEWEKNRAKLKLNVNNEGVLRVLKRMPIDIQAAMTVIGRREWVNKKELGNRIEFDDSYLERLLLTNANLTRAHLVRVNLQDAVLDKSILRYSIILWSNLEGASLEKVDLSWSFLEDVDLSEADLSDAVLYKTDIIGTDLSTTKGLTWEQISKANLDKTTKLPPELEDRRNKEMVSEVGQSEESLSNPE